MVKEKYDRNSGAILFKKDPDSLRTEELLKKVNILEKKVDDYERKIKKLEKSIKDLSSKIKE